jgi:ParB family chromosome partitioning protein
MSGYQNNSIFWVETEKIHPNPFQPRKEFDPHALEDLADSIRQYGVLQPLVVTRRENLREDGDGMDVHYELVAGERRLRASKIAGLHQVPVIIRKDTDNKVKLELAIIENLQREDLNPIDRALAFDQLYKDFKLTHAEIGKRMGKSRVYVSNTLRLLGLPDYIKQAVINNQITEGHTRPLLMLSDRPEEQKTLFKEIMVKKMSVRDSEKVARKIAQDKVRKKEFVVDPKILEMEKKLSENLGTRVSIEAKENGGQVTIDYFSLSDLQALVNSLKQTGGATKTTEMMDNYIQNKRESDSLKNSTPITIPDAPENKTPEQEVTDRSTEPQSAKADETATASAPPVNENAALKMDDAVVETPASGEPESNPQSLPAEETSESINKIPGIPDMTFKPGPVDETPTVPVGTEDDLVDLEVSITTQNESAAVSAEPINQPSASTHSVPDAPAQDEPDFDDNWISFSPGGFNDDPVSSYSQEQKEETEKPAEETPESDAPTMAYTPRDDSGNKQSADADPNQDPYLEPITDEDRTF